MQMRCACTEIILGLKEATRSGEKERWNVQSTIKTMGVATLYKCANAALTIITQQSYLIVAPNEARHGTQMKTGWRYITPTTSTDPQIMTKYSDLILTSLSQS